MKNTRPTVSTQIEVLDSSAPPKVMSFSTMAAPNTDKIRPMVALTARLEDSGT